MGRRSDGRFRGFFLFLALLVTGGLGLIALGILGDPGAGQVPITPAGDPPAAPAQAAALGRADAPVVIYEFSDYECPFCAEQALTVLPALKEGEVARGEVRLVFVDFPLPNHRQAVPAAVAARCAGEQGRYWEMHDLLFARQSEWVRSARPAATFADYARRIGADADRFAACLDSARPRADVERGVAEGRRLGVHSTPTMLVNGRAIVGVADLDELRRSIAAARRAKGAAR